MRSQAPLGTAEERPEPENKMKNNDLSVVPGTAWNAPRRIRPDPKLRTCVLTPQHWKLGFGQSRHAFAAGENLMWKQFAREYGFSFPQVGCIGRKA